MNSCFFFVVLNWIFFFFFYSSKWEIVCVVWCVNISLSLSRWRDVRVGKVCLCYLLLSLILSCVIQYSNNWKRIKNQQSQDKSFSKNNNKINFIYLINKRRKKFFILRYFNDWEIVRKHEQLIGILDEFSRILKMELLRKEEREKDKVDEHFSSVNKRLVDWSIEKIMDEIGKFELD